MKLFTIFLSFLFLIGCDTIFSPHLERSMELIRIGAPRYSKNDTTSTAVYSFSYTVKNTGDMAINQWTIRFNVQFHDTSQYIISETYQVRRVNESWIVFSADQKRINWIQFEREDRGPINKVNLHYLSVE